MDYLNEVKEKYSGIVPFEEDDDNWDKFGFDALKKANYELAQMHFEKLCISQPKHHSGFEGLAYTYYFIHEFEKSEFFMQKAIEIAKTFLEYDSIDIEVINEMEENSISIKDRKQLKMWWL